MVPQEDRQPVWQQTEPSAKASIMAANRIHWNFLILTVELPVLQL